MLKPLLGFVAGGLGKLQVLELQECEVLKDEVVLGSGGVEWGVAFLRVFFFLGFSRIFLGFSRVS